MNGFQLFNSVASLFAAVVYVRAVNASLHFGLKWAVLWRSVSVGVSLWYFGLYLLLGLGLIASNLDVVNAFRFSFPALMLAPALTFLANRRLIESLTASPEDYVRPDNE